MSSYIEYLSPSPSSHLYQHDNCARIRRATLEDIDAIADVVIASLSSDLSWRSLIPSGLRGDVAYGTYAREILMRHLAPENFDSLVLVAEAPTRGSYTIVSVAVWDTAHSRYHQSWRNSCSTMCDIEDIIPDQLSDIHDGITEKLAALSAAISFSQKQHFEQYEPYVYLEVLATHPAYRGQGYAKALCSVGVDSAQKRNLAVAALTSSRGYIFFSGMSFKDLGRVQLGGTECARDDGMLKAMILHPNQKRRRSSVINSFLTYVSLNSSPK